MMTIYEMAERVHEAYPTVLRENLDPEMRRLCIAAEAKRMIHTIRLINELDAVPQFVEEFCRECEKISGWRNESHGAGEN